MRSEINPFDSQEAKPYKNDPEILAMTNLVGAYQRNAIHEFEKILRDNKKTIMDDPFIRAYVEVCEEVEEGAIGKKFYIRL